MSNLTIWEPMREMLSLRQAMDRLFDDAFVGGRMMNRSAGEAEWRLPVEAYTTDHDLVVRAAVPGLKADQVEITLEGDSLTIRGEYPARLEEVTYQLAERPTGRFSRTLQLNVPVQADKVEAVFENGMLTLTLPKAEAIRPRTIQIKAR